jgi:hypothetical protein
LSDPFVFGIFEDDKKNVGSLELAQKLLTLQPAG